MKETETLDQKRIEELCMKFMLAIRENYLQGPVSRHRCYEALNALAATTSLVIKGCDDTQGEAHQWFEQALSENLS